MTMPVDKIWSATLTDEILAKFPNKFFIETGAHRGGGIQTALNCGFAEIHSVESLDRYFQECEDRFLHLINVHLYQGSSIDMLPMMLKDIDAPCTFWLDAHFQDAGTKNPDNYPVRKELALISKYGKGYCHTILVDDRRLMDRHWPVYTEDVIRDLLDMTPPHHVHLIDSRTFKNDIIVAEPLK